MNRRIVDLTTGLTLVVSDLYGDGDAFNRYVARFRQLHSRGRADRLLFLGDLIHPDSRLHGYEDRSLAILITIAQLRAELGADTVIIMAGDHEIAQQHRLPLAAIGIAPIDRLADQIKVLELSVREAINGLFEQLPIFVRTASGVTFSHAGASRAAIMNRHNLDNSDLAVLTEAVGTAAEQAESRAIYARLVEYMLSALSSQENAPAVQRFLVSGHLPIAGGCAMTTPRQLRIASAACASPREAGVYLLFDAAQPIHSLEGLTEHLGSVFTVSATS